MLIDKTAANRYAEAVFNIAQERGLLDDLRTDAQLVRDVYLGPATQKFRTFVESPIFLTREKEALIRKAFDGQISTLLLNFLMMLIRRKRIMNLPLALDEIDRLIDEEKGIITGTVTSAVELDEATRENVTKRLRQLAGEGLQIRFVVQPEILGGLIVRYRDTLIDGSIRTRLKELGQRLKGIELAKRAA